MTGDPGPGTAFVTGGSGFTGRRVIPELVRRGVTVAALARSDEAARTVAEAGAEVVRGDLDRPGDLRAALEAGQPDVLVNVASLGFGHGPGIVAETEAAGVGRAVFVSTTAIFTTLDAATKGPRLAAEEAVTSSGLAWTIVRPTMIYGRPGDRNMERLLRSLRRWPAWPVPGGGHRLQQPVHVDDLAAAIAAAAMAPEAAGQAVQVPGPTPLPFRDIVTQAGAAVGRTPRLVPVPLGPAIAAVAAYERRSARPRLRAEQLQRLDEDKDFDVGPAADLLGHRPRPFSVGIAEEAALLGFDPGPTR